MNALDRFEEELGCPDVDADMTRCRKEASMIVRKMREGMMNPCERGDVLQRIMAEASMFKLAILRVSGQALTDEEKSGFKKVGLMV